MVDLKWSDCRRLRSLGREWSRRCGVALLVGGLLGAFASIAVAGGVQPTFVRLSFDWGTNTTQVDVQLFGEAVTDNALETVANFLLNEASYDDSVLHRLVRGFVMQGGGFNFDVAADRGETCTCSDTETDCPDPKDPPDFSGVFPPIEQMCPPCKDKECPTECPLVDDYSTGRPNTCGTLAMAKSGPNTATTQWFFNLQDNTETLSPGNPAGGFTVFGQIATCELAGDGGYDCRVVADGAVGSCSAAEGFMQPLESMAGLPAFEKPGTCPGPMLPPVRDTDTCIADPNVCESCQGCPEAGTIEAAAASFPLTGYSTVNYFAYDEVEEQHLVILREVLVLPNARITAVPEPGGVLPTALAAAAVLLLARRRAH